MAVRISVAARLDVRAPDEKELGAMFGRALRAAFGPAGDADSVFLEWSATTRVRHLGGGNDPTGSQMSCTCADVDPKQIVAEMLAWCEQWSRENGRRTRWDYASNLPGDTSRTPSYFAITIISNGTVTLDRFGEVKTG